MAILISVCVITYNHENYIRACLDSILSQQLQGDLEVIVRDDASTDGTATILLEYATRYPGIVTVVPTVRNIGANANLLATFSASTGEFIAVCEGDDYWTDTQKLARQLACAREMPTVNFFTHPATAGDEHNHEQRFWPCQASPSFSVSDILSHLGQFAPTASYFFRRSVLSLLPTWFPHAPIGDFFMEMYFTGQGKGYSCPEIMSKYRTFSVGSWDDVIKKDRTGEKGVRAYRLMKVFLKKASPDFKGFEPYFEKRLVMLNFAIAHQYMKVGNYSGFLRYMNKAGTHVQEISRGAAFLFKVRYIKPVVLVLYNLKKLSAYAKTFL